MNRRTVAALLAVLIAPACTRDPGPDAAPSRSAAPSATPSGSPSASPTPEPSGAPTPGPSALSPVPAGATVIGVLGDWGVRRDAARAVVRTMAGFAGGRPLDAVVTTGDNAYQRGRADEAAYARELIQPLLRDGTDLYASLGNHDVGTRGGTHVMRELGMRERWYWTVVGPVELIVLDSTRVADPEQDRFLDRALATRRGRFRVVAFHHPPLSCSAHAPARDVARRWQPRFAGSVDVVLAGHNHTYERFRTPGRPTYVTTGGGGAGLYRSSRALCRGDSRPAVLRTVHHAVRLVATSDRLTLEAVGIDGRVFDRVELPATD